MSRREDREKPKVMPLVTDAQAHRALEDLMPLLEALTEADTLLTEVQEGRISTATPEGRHLLDIMAEFRAIQSSSPAIDAYIRWLERGTGPLPVDPYHDIKAAVEALKDAGAPETPIAILESWAEIEVKFAK